MVCEKKRKGLGRGLIALLCLTGIALAAVPVRAESVNRLMLEAQDALTAADFEPDPLTELDLLRRALARFDRIVNEHPDNPLADQIGNGGRVAGTSRPKVAARIAALRRAPEICLAEPDADCLTAVAVGLTSKLALLRDRVAAQSEIAVALAKRGERAAAAGQIGQAVVWALRIKAARSRARALLRTADAQARIGDGAGARRSLDQAFKAVQPLPRDGERSRLMSQIAAGLFALEARTETLEILRTAMHDAAEVRDADAKVELLTRLARLFRDVGDSETAERLVDSARLTIEQMAEPYDQSWGQLLTARALTALAQRDAARTLVNQAVETAQSLDAPQRRAGLITEAAGLLADWGAEDAAGDLLDALLMQALELEAAGDRRTIIWWIARTRIAAGHRPHARLALAHALEAADGAPGARRAAYLSQLAVALAKVGDAGMGDVAATQALAAARGLSDPDRRALALLQVAVAFSRMGQVAAAAELLAEVRDAGGYRTPAFSQRAGIAPLLAIAAALSGPGKGESEAAVTPRN